MMLSGKTSTNKVGKKFQRIVFSISLDSKCNTGYKIMYVYYTYNVNYKLCKGCAVERTYFGKCLLTTPENSYS